MQITWKRSSGTRTGVVTAYEGASEAGVSYSIESKDVYHTAAGAPRREFRAFRLVGRTRHPAADGRPLRTLKAAKRQAERDLGHVLDDRASEGRVLDVEQAHAGATWLDGDLSSLADSYEAGNDATIERVNADTTWVGNAVRAELQRREETREAASDPDAEWVAKFDRDIAAVPGPGVNCVHCGEGAADHGVKLYCPTGYGRYSVELTSDTETTRQLAHRIIAEVRAPQDATPQRGPLYLPTAWSDVLPDRPSMTTGSGKSADDSALVRSYLDGEIDVLPAPTYPMAIVDDQRAAAVLAIPDEAVAMNAGYDMAVKSAWSGYDVDTDAFAANVQRHQR